MRATRFLLLLMAIGLGAAACAPQPVAYYTPAAPTGIDAAVYGAPAARPVIAAAPAAANASSRGLLQSFPFAFAPGYAGYRPSYAPAAAPAQIAAPVYAPSPPPAPGAGYGSGPYTLDSGDRLRIVVFGQDGLTNSYAVDASGHIDMPLIGSVLARGATTDELAARIAAKLRDGYVRDPHVAVEVEAYRPFFILGEVTAPGQYPYVANMTAETAVAIAGGFTPRAFRKTVVVTRTLNGQQMRMVVPLNCPLRPGDTVNVQERWF